MGHHAPCIIMYHHVSSCITMHHAPCTMHHHASNIIMLLVSCIIMHHASCIMHHASCIMHHSSSYTTWCVYALHCMYERDFHTVGDTGKRKKGETVRKMGVSK